SRATHLPGRSLALEPERRAGRRRGLFPCPRRGIRDRGSSARTSGSRGAGTVVHARCGASGLGGSRSHLDQDRGTAVSPGCVCASAPPPWSARACGPEGWPATPAGAAWRSLAPAADPDASGRLGCPRAQASIHGPRGRAGCGPAPSTPRSRWCAAAAPAIFIIVSLREPERDVATYVSRAAEQHPREWLAALRRLFASGDRRLMRVSELERVRASADHAHACLSDFLAVRPARGVE